MRLRTAFRLSVAEASKFVSTETLLLKHYFRSEKLQNESFPNFSIFHPEFCPEFCLNFLRSFRASFCGRRRPEKIHQKSPPFFNAKFPGKFEEKIHNIFLERRQSNKILPPSRFSTCSDIFCRHSLSLGCPAICPLQF